MRQIFVAFQQNQPENVLPPDSPSFNNKVFIVKVWLQDTSHSLEQTVNIWNVNMYRHCSQSKNLLSQLLRRMFMRTCPCVQTWVFCFNCSFVYIFQTKLDILSLLGICRNSHKLNTTEIRCLPRCYSSLFYVKKNKIQRVCFRLQSLTSLRVLCFTIFRAWTGLRF